MIYTPIIQFDGHLIRGIPLPGWRLTLQKISFIQLWDHGGTVVDSHHCRHNCQKQIRSLHAISASTALPIDGHPCTSFAQPTMALLISLSIVDATRTLRLTCYGVSLQDAHAMSLSSNVDSTCVLGGAHAVVQTNQH